MTDSISNSDDIIDSREVIARIAELTAEREHLEGAIEIAQVAVHDAPQDSEAEAEAQSELEDAERALSDWQAEVGDELTALEALVEDAEGVSDWQHGAQLISRNYWAQHVKQFAEDIGAINRDASWPNDCIDWDKAANELEMDYSSVDFDGKEYLVRS